MKNLDYKKIGERLYKLREYMGLTQIQVAEILNVGRDAILRVEKGKRKIDIEELVNFSKLYNISIDEIIDTKTIESYTETVYARGFSELSTQDKKEILDLIEYKNILKSKDK